MHEIGQKMKYFFEVYGKFAVVTPDGKTERRRLE